MIETDAQQAQRHVLIKLGEKFVVLLKMGESG